MSASSKKKLRKAQEAELLTEKQIAAQAEAKKLKIFSTIMVVVLAVMVVFAAYTAISNGVMRSGALQRGTTAVTVGDHEINAIEYNCFYNDAVYNFYSQYGSYASLLGLDVTKPLDQQVYDENEGTTWADAFKLSAEENIKTVYALTDAANEAGFTLTEEQKASITAELADLESAAKKNNFSGLKAYLEAIYGFGANEENVRAYMELCALAGAYQQSVKDGLTYTADDIRAEDEANGVEYTNYTYNSYYLAVSKFLEGGTKAEDGTTTYSDEEKAAAVAAAEEAAKALTNETITSVEAMDAAVAALAINAEASNAATTANTDYTYDYLPTDIAAWVSDAARQAGDVTYIASVTENEDGTETVNGYYAVYFVERNDNNVYLQNVRHILSAFKGGTTAEDGTKTYSVAEKEAAKVAAEEIYAQWLAGEATEESFAALANEKSDDGDGTTGGLYTDVTPGYMVENFNNWIFDTARQAGDHEIIETEYGYHVMYYVGASEQTYRDSMIESTLRNNDLNAWLDELVADVTVEAVDYKYVPTDKVLSN